MKVEVRNLHSEILTVDCDGDDTVKQLKEKIAAKDGWKEKYDPELLKLLCAGKVMDDEDTVNTYTIKPDGYLVLVKQTPGKPKPPPKKKPNQGGFNNSMGGFGSNGMMQSPFGNQPFGQSSFGQNSFGQSSFGQSSFGQNSFGQNTFQQPSFGQNTFQQPAFNQNSLGQNQFGAQSQFPATGAPSGLSDTPPDAFSTPEDREEALQTLLNMGFEKSQSEKALRASYYNVETAIEYITSGNIPTVADKPVVPTGAGLGQPPSVLGNQPNPPPARHQGGGGGAGANLQQMRQMLQQNPEQLQVLKHTLQAEHPEIAQMIDENPQAFLDLLNQAGSNDEGGPAPSAVGAGGVGAGGGQGQGGIPVSLSGQEQQIITRLQEMGFDRNRAIEAFLACDRNENLAINYLLNAFD